MKKCRIIERVFRYDFSNERRIRYIIQQKNWFFGSWIDAKKNKSNSNCKDIFDTLEEAIEHLPFFDGTKSDDGTKVVYKNY